MIISIASADSLQIPMDSEEPTAQLSRTTVYTPFPDSLNESSQYCNAVTCTDFRFREGKFNHFSP